MINDRGNPGALCVPAAVPPPLGGPEFARLLTAVRRGRVLTLTAPRREPAGRVARVLAQRLGSNFFDGTAVVSMDRPHGPADVAAALGALEGMPFLPCGTADATSWLAERDMLLVLVGAEQLAPAARTWLRRLLAAAPGVRILATGRSPLRLPEERVHRLQGN
ncbi:hypothetical protein LG634_34445 [Streptomyces bambusae]|uniref:hypothetical protein n=1 Tax=Streptomyces bambusae TaxID=1550616 RepID=UPI001D001712|nr:hypothetical protein [Streptomyces bambusae]MCB5169889.1 hypothetical protein [Streptomyces bambusae]